MDMIALMCAGILALGPAAFAADPPAAGHGDFTAAEFFRVVPQGQRDPRLPGRVSFAAVPMTPEQAVGELLGSWVPSSSCDGHPFTPELDRAFSLGKGWRATGTAAPTRFIWTFGENAARLTILGAYGTPDSTHILETYEGSWTLGSIEPPAMAWSPDADSRQKEAVKPDFFEITLLHFMLPWNRSGAPIRIRFGFTRIQETGEIILTVPEYGMNCRSMGLGDQGYRLFSRVSSGS